jgi:uncharacterized protein (TIGR00730 family)
MSSARDSLTPIAVFGGSDCEPDSPLYAQAREVGLLLGRAGCRVITGGYGGVMEAASRGAQEGGGSSLGITVRAFSGARAGPNPYLTDHIEAAGLFDRTEALIGRSMGYIILRGKAGTLAELTLIWALQRARLQEGRPIVLLGEFWQPLLQQLTQLELVEESQLAVTFVAATAAQAVERLLAQVRRGTR